MADDEKCVQVDSFVWKWHESVGWYDADEDDPTFGNEGVLLDEIERLRAEIERLCAAGDVIACVLASLVGDRADVRRLLDAWEEARRG